MECVFISVIYLVYKNTAGPWCYYLVSLMPSTRYYFRSFLSLSLSLDVAQTRGHQASCSPPSPLRYRSRLAFIQFFCGKILLLRTSSYFSPRRYRSRLRLHSLFFCEKILLLLGPPANSVLVDSHRVMIHLPTNNRIYITLYSLVCSTTSRAALSA